MAQLVKRPTSAQVMISQSVGSSPVSGSVLTAWSLEPASDSVSPSLSAPLFLTLCLCLSLKNKQTLKQFFLKEKDTKTERQNRGPEKPYWPWPCSPQLTDQQLHNVGARVLPHVLDPVRHRQKGAPLGDVVSQDGPVGTAVIALGDGAESLLASCVPDLQLKK